MSQQIPQMTFHKASGHAVVRLSGQDIYLGPWKSAAAKRTYDRAVSEWLANGRLPRNSSHDLTITELIAAFWDHAQTYYRHTDGTLTNEVRNYRDALRPLRRLYGHSAAKDFGPLALKSIRQSMIDANLCRTSINRRISRIRHVFRWGIQNELVPAAVYHGLQAVEGLKAGRSEACESAPVRPVTQEYIDAVLPFVSRQVGAMIELQIRTAMRPGEVVSMRATDIDTTGKLWIYRPASHKTQHLGHERAIYLGPKAKSVIAPFLKPNLEGFLFSPIEAEAERREKLHQARKTPLSCGNIPGTNIKRSPKWKPHDHYAVNSYSRAIKYAAERAFPLPEHLRPRKLENGKYETVKAWQARLTTQEKIEIKDWRRAHNWHPHQLRHTAATELRRNYGLEPVQAVLGHKTLTVTQVYAEKNLETAMRIMAEVG
jgi:site-specific recombinase XerD